MSLKEFYTIFKGLKKMIDEQKFNIKANMIIHTNFCYTNVKQDRYDKRYKVI